MPKPCPPPDWEDEDAVIAYTVWSWSTATTDPTGAT
jgi:hypothetical protein